LSSRHRLPPLNAKCFALLQRWWSASATGNRTGLKLVEAEHAHAAANALAMNSFSGGVGPHRRPMAEFPANDWGFISAPVGAILIT
jgi:hypothetical protein